MVTYVLYSRDQRETCCSSQGGRWRGCPAKTWNMRPATVTSSHPRMKRRMSGPRPRGQDSKGWLMGWPNPGLDETMCGIGIRMDRESAWRCGRCLSPMPSSDTTPVHQGPNTGVVVVQSERNVFSLDDLPCPHPEGGPPHHLHSPARPNRAVALD